jgi:MFS family permease
MATREAGLLRRNPDFARLYGSSVVSYAGDWFAWVALQGLVLEKTESPALAGLMLAMATLPYAIVSPFAGVIADRFDRKKLMIGADIFRTVVSLGFLAARSESTVWIAFVCNGLLSASAPFFEAPSQASLPNLVPLRDLARANVLMGSLWGTMLAVGAALGGLVAATLGRDAAFVLNAVSFAGSGALIAAIRGRFREHDIEPSRITVLEDIRVAIRFARSDARVTAILLVKGIFGLGGGTIALLSIMAVRVFDGGDAGIGILLGARGVGALTGPFLWRRFVYRGRDERLIRSIGLACSVYAVCYALFSQAPNIWIAALAVAAAHIGGGANWTMSSYALQRFTPDAVRGRIFSFDYAMITLSMTIAFAAAGFAADRFDPRDVALVSATATLGAAGLWWMWAARAVPRSALQQPEPETQPASP